MLHVGVLTSLSSLPRPRAGDTEGLTALRVIQDQLGQHHGETVRSEDSQPPCLAESESALGQNSHVVCMPSAM